MRALAPEVNLPLTSAAEAEILRERISTERLKACSTPRLLDHNFRLTHYPILESLAT
jgi:hypothetical protein